MKRKLKTELDREMVIGQIKRLDLSKDYTIDILLRRKVRSISQNSLYWLWLSCIEFETGNDKDDLHDHFKKKWLEPIDINLFGESFFKWSTKDLNTIQFKYYLDKIHVFASTELSITLPNPEDQYWDEFYSFYIDKL
ncbi:MAG TPA: hypothetical protein VMV77_04715 [Bacteroidales bacterium]|nr:hypothetical protein [Bacteroidales bacterium]